MKKIIVLHKKEGETPLEALENFRKKQPEYEGTSLTYAGRLDPMASGVLIILADSKIYDKEKFLALDKTYQVSILLGIETDTGDILGKVTALDSNQENAVKNIRELKQKIEKNKKYFLGKTLQEYPSYSSKTVNGLALFEYARQNKKVKIPKHYIFIKKMATGKLQKISRKKLFSRIEKRVALVKGDFRQKEIIAKWKKTLLSQKETADFWAVDFTVTCTSGTYMRKLAQDFGRKMGGGGLALAIKRMRVGRYF